MTAGRDAGTPGGAGAGEAGDGVAARIAARFPGWDVTVERGGDGQVTGWRATRDAAGTALRARPAGNLLTLRAGDPAELRRLLAAFHLHEEHPSPGRVHAHLLDPRQGMPADRDAAGGLACVYPAARVAADSRSFLTAAVTALARDGVTQFLDLGAGMPLGGGHPCVHEIAGPDARVLYVDDDPFVVCHLDALAARPGRVGVVQADVGDTCVVLGAAAALLDWSRPVAVLASMVLHHVDGDDRQVSDMIGEYTRPLADGSHLLISHLCGPPTLARVLESAAGYWMRPRTRGEIAGLFPEDAELLPPGVVNVRRWRTSPVPGGDARPAPPGRSGPVSVVGGVARFTRPARRGRAGAAWDGAGRLGCRPPHSPLHPRGGTR